MKNGAIVLVDADGDSLGPVLEASARCGYATWNMRDCGAAWTLLRSGGEGVAGGAIERLPGRVWKATSCDLWGHPLPAGRSLQTAA